MSKAAYKLPSVFVGCPYDDKKFGFTSFQNALNRIPFRWYYADTSLSTKHLLGILTTYIKAVDFCIFDVSLWNPNVALEIGLAQGLGVDYYIVVNGKLTKGVPSDIQGIQRIQYDSNGGLSKNDLVPNLVKYLVRDYTHPRNIWNEISSGNKDMKYYFALSVLSHFRDSKRLPHAQISTLAQGTYLRSEAQQEILQQLYRMGLISDPARGAGCHSKRNLFPDRLRIK